MRITPFLPIECARTTDPKLRQIFALRPHAIPRQIALAEDQETQIGSLPKPTPLEADDFCCVLRGLRLLSGRSKVPTEDDTPRELFLRLLTGGALSRGLRLCCCLPFLRPRTPANTYALSSAPAAFAFS